MWNLKITPVVGNFHSQILPTTNYKSKLHLIPAYKLIPTFIRDDVGQWLATTRSGTCAGPREICYRSANTSYTFASSVKFQN